MIAFPSCENHLALIVNRVRRYLFWVAAMVSAVASTAPSATAQSVAPTEIKLSVPGPGNSVSIPLELAVKIGADRAEGIQLRLKFVGGGGVAISDLLSGDADYAVFGVPAAMNKNLGKPAIVALAAIDDLPLYTLMVRANLRAKVKTIADLRGMVVGIHSNSLQTKTTSHQVADLVFRINGIKPEELRYVAAGQNWETQSSALISENIDATFCDEPFAERMAAEKLAFRLYTTGDPADASRTPGAAFLRAALMSRRDRVEQQPEIARRMVNVMKRTLAWIASHSADEAAEVLGFSGIEKKVFVDIAKKYPRQHSRDGMFSTSQLRETDIFFRAQDTTKPAQQTYSVESMIVDKWAGRKP